jgi:hypothetical protein
LCGGDQIVARRDLGSDRKRRMSTEQPSVSPDFVHLQEEAVLSGYLYKKTRDGRWQRRWFETNGVYLTYYKVPLLLSSSSRIFDDLCHLL